MNEVLASGVFYGNTESIRNYIPRLLAVARALVLCQEAKFELEVLLDRDAVVLRAPTVTLCHDNMQVYSVRPSIFHLASHSPRVLKLFLFPSQPP